MKKVLTVLAATCLLILSMPALAANCYIAEFGVTAQDANGNKMPLAGPMLTSQVVAYTTSTQSTAFSANTRYIRVVCDAKAHFTFGTNPTADANDPYFVADVPEYVGVNATWEIAFYDGTS